MEIFEMIEKFLKENKGNDLMIVNEITDTDIGDIESIGNFKDAEQHKKFIKLLERECIKKTLQADEKYSFNKVTLYLHPTTKEIEWIVIDE